jgi:hypothetical protein
MSIYPNVLRASCDIETTFGTTPSGTYLDQRMVEGTFAPRFAQATLPDMTVQSRVHDRASHRVGSKFGCGFAASFYVDGLPSGLVSASTFSHPQNNVAEMLRALMGGQTGDVGSTIDSACGADTTVITVTTAANFGAGEAVVVNNEMRRIASVAGNELTLDVDLSAAPGSATVVYNTATFYLDEDGVGGSGDSLNWQVVAQDAGDGYQFEGCAGTFTLRTGLDELLVMDADFQAADWSRLSGVSLTSGLSYTGGGPLPISAGRLYMAASGTTTLITLPCPQFEFNPGLVLAPERALNGTETVVRWRMMRSEPTISFFIPHSMSSWQTYFDKFLVSTATRDEYKIFLQIGNTPITSSTGAGCVGISLPQCMLDGPPERGVGPNGLTGFTLRFRAREDQDGTITSDVQRSAFSIHLA